MTNGVVGTTIYTYPLKAGGTITKTRHDRGPKEKSFSWPPGTKMSDVGLYNQDLLDRLAPGEPWVLVEGEKTADALVARGIVAVSLPGGSGQRDLSALDVLANHPKNPGHISPDNDAPGLKAATAWYEHLKRIHPQVRWVPPVMETPGGDFADLLSSFSDDDDADARFEVFSRLSAALTGPPGPTPVEVPKESGFEDALAIWTMAEPPEREWLVEDFIPDRWPTLLYGDGGAGKSTLATHLAMHVAMGRDWFGRRVKQANVLFVDAELDDEEFRRRMWPLARGMSLDSPPPGVYYWRMSKAISNDDVLDHLFGLVTKHRIGFVIVDSLTIATHLSDQNISTDLLKLIFALQKWGVPFQFLDHHAKSAINGDPDSTSPYGSVYKRNAVRSMTYMQTGVKGSARLHCRKSNFGPKWEPFSIGADWIGAWPNQSIVYSRLAENDPRNLALKSEETKNETLEALRTLADEYPTGVPTKAVAEYLAITEDTARMRLGRLEKMRPAQASRPDRGKWLPVNEPPPPEPNR